MSYRDLLALRGFRNLWLGQAISQIGDALYSLIFLFMVDNLTHDPAMVGIAGVAQTLPFLLFSLNAGVIADRMDRKKIMLFADLTSAVILLLFALFLWFDPTPPVIALILAGAALSCINVFFAPAKSAAIPNLVPPEALSIANGLSMATQNLMPLIGIGFSGTVLAVLYSLSPSYFFLSAVILNALSFLASAAFIVRLPTLRPANPETKNEAMSPLSRAFQDMRDGIAYLWQEKVLRVTLILNILVMLFISPFMVVYMLVNREWFGGQYWTLALCEGGFFVGVVINGFIVGKREVRRPGIAFIWGMAIIGITVFGMAFARSVWLFALLNFLAGFGLPLAQIPMTTYIQTVVPDHYRGRVNAVMTMANMGVQPLAIGIGGMLLKQIGPVLMLLGMGGGMTLAAFAGFIDRPFRNATLSKTGDSGPE